MSGIYAITKTRQGEKGEDYGTSWARNDWQESDILHAQILQLLRPFHLWGRSWNVGWEGIVKVKTDFSSENKGVRTLHLRTYIKFIFKAPVFKIRD